MWVKAVLSALPILSINPTSSVTLDNTAEYLSHGAVSVGLVALLVGLMLTLCHLTSFRSETR